MSTIEVAEEKLNEITSSVGELPAAPAIVSVAMGLTSDLQSNVEDISRVLAADQSLVAKVLKISNSPYYGRASEVTTLHEAITVMGFLSIRSIVVAASSHGMYDTTDPDGPENKLWRHSLSTAIAARKIAEHIKHPEKEEAFIAALMHDIGKLVLLEKVPDWYRRVIESVEAEGLPFFEMERRLFRFDHCDVASLLLDQWSFPKHLVRAIAKHHNPPSFARGGPVPIAHVVNLANAMAKQLKVGFDGDWEEDISGLESARLLKIDEKSLSEILTEVEGNYREEIRIFEESSGK